MTSPRISVVIPTYARPTYLKLTLESLASQTYPPAEVIIVDDCSPEPVVVPTDLPFTPRVLRHLRNQGPGATRNTGMSHATGDWVLFLDDDDLLVPQRLEWAVEEMGEARAHVTDIEWFYPDGSTRRPHRRVYSGDMRERLTIVRAPQLGQVVFRREEILQFDPTLRVAQDTEWWLRMADRAVFAWNPKVGLRYRCHPEARAGVRADTRFRARRQVALRHAKGSDRRIRAQLYGNVGAEALVAGRRLDAALWSLRSLAARPSLLNVKRLARSVRGLPD